MEQNPSPKDLVEAKYKELIDIFGTAANSIESIKKSKNREVMEMRDDIVAKLDELIIRVKDETFHTLEAVRWDNLVIAFFGETNAGKSTIIETFRILFDKNRPMEQDGQIVGDGRADFTQTYCEYPLEIAGRKFTLIDVPGIEGNESQYSEKIREALRKAHCVFYVQGHNKKPDEATAAKIKEYLGDWVNVYSIQNVRGGTSDYDEEEERETLLTARVEQNEQLIRDSFIRILGDKVYKGNIPLQALLAMCANASFAPERGDLKKQQKKLLSYFGSPDAVLRFSQFQTLINLVEEKSGCFMEEIIEANKQKMLSLSKRAEVEIEKALEEQREQNELFQENLNLFKREVKTLFGKTKTALRNKVNGAIDSAHNKLKTETYAILDSNGSKDDIKRRIRNRVANLNYLPGSLADIIDNELAELKENIDRKMKKTPDVCNRVKEPSFLPVKQSDIIPEIQDALEELDVTLDDVGDFALTAAGGFVTGAALGSWVPIAGNIVGGLIGAGLVSVSKWILSDGGKGKARQEMDKAFAKSRMLIKDSISHSISSTINDLNKQETNILDQISQLQESFDDLDNTISELKNDMNNYNYKINVLEYGRISI